MVLSARLVAGLLPWTPLLGLMARRTVYRDGQRVFLAVWVLVVLVLFSISVNKLPGYILPLLPAAAALMALALDEVSDARVWLAACAALLVAFPITAQVLPAAVLNGLSRAPRPVFQAVWLAPAGVALLAWMLEARGKRVAAVLGSGRGSGSGDRLLEDSRHAGIGPQCLGARFVAGDRRARGRGLYRQRQARLGVRTELLFHHAAARLRQGAEGAQVLPAAGGRAYLRPAP